MSEGGLVDDLLMREPANVKMQCGFTRIYLSLGDKERAAVDAALERIKNDTGAGRAKVYSYSWLSEVLKKNGHQISSSTVARHMTKRCGCE
jgi:hypothetical protein